MADEVDLHRAGKLRIAPDASADQPRRTVPRPREFASDRSRRRPGDPRPVDEAERGPHLPGHLCAARGAAAAAAAASLAPRGGPARARLSLLARRPRLRPRLPRPGAGPPSRRDSREAGGAGGSHRLAATRPGPSALGAVPDPRPGGWPGGDPHQDPPRRDRRPLRRRDRGGALRPRAGGPRASRAATERIRPRAERARDADPGAAQLPALPAAHAPLAAARTSQPRRVAGFRRDPRHRPGRQARRPSHPADLEPRDRGPRPYQPQGAEDTLQRPDLTAPALCLRATRPG